MRHNFSKLLSLVVAAASLGIPLAAQSQTAIANVPFAFIGQDTSMPAGEYRISNLSEQPNEFVLQGDNGHSVIVNMTVNETGDATGPKLTFAHFGDQYVLARIAPADSDLAYGLSQSSIEKSLRHKVGISSMVSVPLRRR